MMRNTHGNIDTHSNIQAPTLKIHIDTRSDSMNQ